MALAEVLPPLVLLDEDLVLDLDDLLLFEEDFIGFDLVDLVLAETILLEADFGFELDDFVIAIVLYSKKRESWFGSSKRKMNKVESQKW